MSRYTTPPSLERPFGSGSPIHAGGMKASSRRLSAATPPETNIKQIASQWDASPNWARRRRMGVFADIPSGCGPFRKHPGGVADAQPPANRGDASGIESVAVGDLGYYSPYTQERRIDATFSLNKSPVQSVQIRCTGDW